MKLIRQLGLLSKLNDIENNKIGNKALLEGKFNEIASGIADLRKELSDAFPLLPSFERRNYENVGIHIWVLKPHADDPSKRGSLRRSWKKPDQ